MPALSQNPNSKDLKNGSWLEIQRGRIFKIQFCLVAVMAHDNELAIVDSKKERGLESVGMTFEEVAQLLPRYGGKGEATMGEKSWGRLTAEWGHVSLKAKREAEWDLMEEGLPHPDG